MHYGCPECFWDGADPEEGEQGRVCPECGSSAVEEYEDETEYLQTQVE